MAKGADTRAAGRRQIGQYIARVCTRAAVVEVGLGIDAGRIATRQSISARGHVGAAGDALSGGVANRAWAAILVSYATRSATLATGVEATIAAAGLAATRGSGCSTSASTATRTGGLSVSVRRTLTTISTGGQCDANQPRSQSSSRRSQKRSHGPIVDGSDRENPEKNKLPQRQVGGRRTRDASGPSSGRVSGCTFDSLLSEESEGCGCRC